MIGVSVSASRLSGLPEQSTCSAVLHPPSQQRSRSHDQCMRSASLSVKRAVCDGNDVTATHATSQIALTRKPARAKRDLTPTSGKAETQTDPSR